MNLKISKRLAFLSTVMLFGCKNQPTDFYTYKIDIRGERNMRAKCDSVYYKKISLEIVHESLDSIALSQYRLVVDIDGVVYNGSYQSKLIFEKFDLCYDFAMNHSPLIIYMIDEENQVKYKWRNDMLFAFEKYSNFRVKLKYKHIPHAEDDLNSYFVDYN